MTQLTPGHLAPPDDGERAARIDALRSRGLQEARREFDPERHLIGQPGRYAPARSLPLAQALLEQGDAASVLEASAILSAALEAQETAPNHPHRGNFLWLADDEEVADLNAVQVVLRGLLPLLSLHGQKLPPELYARCREAVRLALEEEERMDVAPTYSGVHVVSLFCTLLGGQWLGDAHFQALGRERWARWVRFTVGSGTTHEYNSPNYGVWALGALALIHRFVRDPEIRLQARLLHERLWLSLVLRLHRPTQQLAGPHSRCYWGTMLTGQMPLKEVLWRETGWTWPLAPGPYGGHDASELPSALDLALAEYWLPSSAATWLMHQNEALPYEVRETANTTEGADLTTYLAPSYALGTASRTYSIGTDCFYIEHEANHLMLHYARPWQPGGWGMLYSRFVVNDQHWGTLGAAPDRPKTGNFYDQGHFAGAQRRNKAIGLYALMPEPAEVFSLKTVIALQSGDAVDGVWLNDGAVDLGALPRAVSPGDWVIVADGDVYIGLYPLEPSCLGREAPILLENGPLGELWLTIYNYRGKAKRFWDYASLRGAFWRGNLRAGFIVEVAERGEYPSASGFLDHLRQATVQDTVDEAHIRTVTYASGADELTLRYDLWNTRPRERRLNGRTYRTPNLASPLAAQGDTGELRVGQAVLVTDPQQMWLIAQELDPKERAWVAVNPQANPTPLRLETPHGVITAEAWGMGRLEWRAPAEGPDTLIVDVLEEPVGLRVPGGVAIEWVKQ